MAWQIRLSVCRLWRACTLLTGFNFSGIFLHRIAAWLSGNSPTKNHEDRPRGSPPPRGLNRKGVVKILHIVTIGYLISWSLVLLSIGATTVGTGETVPPTFLGWTNNVLVPNFLAVVFKKQEISQQVGRWASSWIRKMRLALWPTSSCCTGAGAAAPGEYCY